jgi:hypothetical protein
MSKNLANGQVASSATAIYTATGPDCINILFGNTSGGSTETVVVTVLRNGGTSRNLFRAVLAPNEHAIIANLPVESGDIVRASATDAATVDYDVTGLGQAATTTFPPEALALVVYDANGAIKQVNTGISGNQTISGTAIIAKLELSPQPTDTYAAAMTIDVTKSCHIISASNTTSATATLTPSAAGTAGDVLVIVTEADASGTVTATFASTFHPSGTQATTASHFSSIVFVSDGTRWVEVCRTTAVA